MTSDIIPTSEPLPPPDALNVATERTFTKKTVIWLAVVAALSLAATLVVPVLEEDRPSRVSAQNDAYSKSAVGHHALVAFLREAGVSVKVSRYRSASKAGPGRPLLISEPDAYEGDELKQLIADALGNRAPVVVVLPKWDEEIDEDRSDRSIKGAQVHSTEVPGAVLADAYLAGQKVLYDYEWGGSAEEGVRDSVFRVAGDAPGAAESRWHHAMDYEATPTLPSPQLVSGTGSGLEAVAWEAGDTDDNILIGAWPDLQLYIITDPDLLNTMGLDEGDNALFIYRFLVDYLQADGLVVDEILHGYEKPESIWAELMTFPLVLVTMHLLGLLLLVLWAALSRFGKPADRPPRVAPGKQVLVHNTATLLALGGHVGHGLREYFRTALRDVARAYALPPEQSDAARLKTLSKLATQRGVTSDLADLATKVAAVRDTKREQRRAVSLARRIYRFRQEMIDGHRSHQAAR